MPPPPTASNSTASTSRSSDGKRHMRRKDFQYKYGQRHHSYDSEKAPYPLSYDKHVLELESLDNRLAQYLRGSISFVNFDEPPARVLDLGCGTGVWVIDAAKAWPECELVGFDLVDTQIPLKLLDPPLADRIEWRHGNFLTTKLPFDDDEFDHVHIQSIAAGVPENKWGVLFQEVSRVLQPGGSVEVIEDDVIFPTLPRWFTTALRARPLRSKPVRYPDSSNFSREYPTHPPNHSLSSSSDIPSHDHALLESLYRSVFEHRFINLKPSSLLPIYLTTYFRQVDLGPVVNFPMPPFAPLLPLPPQITTSYVVEPLSDLADRRASTITASPKSPAHSGNRPVSLSFSSTLSNMTGTTAYSQSSYSSQPPTASNGEKHPSSSDGSSSDVHPLVDIESLPLKCFMLDSPLTGGDITSLPPGSLFPMEQLLQLSRRSLAMHLYRNYQAVLACQEAIWEELKDRIRNKKNELVPFGWNDDEELEELQSRKKFERLIERYRSDMQARVSLWCSLDSFGWPLPVRESLSKAELIEEERLRESMLEARKQATAEEMQIPCRAMRVIVGHKN